MHLVDREDTVLDRVFQQNVLTVATQKLLSAVAQIVLDDDRRACGTQFRPEYWADEHPAGRTMMTNFLEWPG